MKNPDDKHIRNMSGSTIKLKQSKEFKVPGKEWE